MNAITLIWKQILKELKRLQTEEITEKDKEEKTIKDRIESVESDGEEPSNGKKEGEKETRQKQPVRLTQEVRAFLQEYYDFRYNLLTDETEYILYGSA